MRLGNLLLFQRIDRFLFVALFCWPLRSVARGELTIQLLGMAWNRFLDQCRDHCSLIGVRKSHDGVWDDPNGRFSQIASIEGIGSIRVGRKAIGRYWAIYAGNFSAESSGWVYSRIGSLFKPPENPTFRYIWKRKFPRLVARRDRTAKGAIKVRLRSNGHDTLRRCGRGFIT